VREQEPRVESAEMVSSMSVGQRAGMNQSGSRARARPVRRP
jgi:hypothetical protein